MSQNAIRWTVRAHIIERRLGVTKEVFPILQRGWRPVLLLEFWDKLTNTLS